jgi:hypothetical protein
MILKHITVLLFITESPPFGPIEGHKWFFQISSQWESEKNQFAFISFGKIQFLVTSLHFRFPVHVVPPQVDDWLSAFSKAELRLTIPLSCTSLVGGGGGDSDAASGKISIISKCFHRSKQELKKYFSRLWKWKKIYKTSAPIQKVLIWFLKKLFISWHCPFKVLCCYTIPLVQCWLPATRQGVV